MQPGEITPNVLIGLISMYKVFCMRYVRKQDVKITQKESFMCFDLHQKPNLRQ